MKVVQIPFCFYPDAVGGTEVYVASLVHLLRYEHGCDVLIAAPGSRSEEYTHENLRVRRFAVSNEVGDVSELYGEGDELGAREFDRILREEQPDIVHLHAFTRGVSLRIVRAAKARKVPVVFTYHTPTVTCTRGTMMRWGRIPCDGEMLGRRCTACTLQGLGMNRLVAEVLSFMPSALRPLLKRPGKSGGMWTALRMRELVERRHSATRALFAEVDHVVAVCEWVRDVLIRNGVPAGKITLCRQGIDMRQQDNRLQDNKVASPVVAWSRSRPLKLAFFGRLDPTKGVHVVISALRSLPSAPITLDIYGTTQGESGAAYETRLKKLVGDDPRIRFCSPVPADQVVRTIHQYDMLAVPSQWLETGPLVVLEAFAAGVPVIGSDLGGIAELVQNGVNGILVNATSPNSWGKTLEQLCGDANALKTSLYRIGKPPSMSSVARKMIGLYGNLAPHHASA